MSTMVVLIQTLSTLPQVPCQIHFARNVTSKFGRGVWQKRENGRRGGVHWLIDGGKSNAVNILPSLRDIGKKWVWSIKNMYGKKMTLGDERVFGATAREKRSREQE